MTMNPRLTRGEYWLLETAVTFRCPMCYLCSEHYREPDGIEWFFNKTGHNLNRSDLVATLAALFQEGLIEAVRDDEVCQLSDLQIGEALSEKRTLENPNWTCFRLTARGGAVWEDFAAPRWDRFVLDDWIGLNKDDHEFRSGSAMCQSERRLQFYLDGVYILEYEIDAQSVEIKECGPWNPTYWKELPHGYEAQFQWKKGPPRPVDRLHQLAFAGFCDYRDSWYRWR